MPKRVLRDPSNLTTYEVAGMLGINRRTLLSWLYQGKIPEPRRVGNKRVWSTEEVEELRKLIIRKGDS